MGSKIYPTMEFTFPNPVTIISSIHHTLTIITSIWDLRFYFQTEKYSSI